MRSLKWLRAAAFTLLLVTASCGGGGDDTTTGPRTDLNPEDQVPEIQVQFVDHKFRNAALSGENLDSDPILSLIFSASTSLDIAVTRIDRQAVVDALLSEATSGTQIRIVTEKAYYDDPAFRPYYDQLEDPTKNAGNIEIHPDSDGLPRQMHSRFMVIDNARVVTGSYNWESSTSDDTFGDVINILNTSIAAAFSSQFNQMFVENRFGVDKRDDTVHTFLVGGATGTVEVYFGPTDRPRDLLQTEINASNNVFFAVQQFNDIPLANSLLTFMSQGNSVAGYFNDFGSTGSAAENNVYFTFANYAANPPAGSCIVNGMWLDDNGDGVVDQAEVSHLTGSDSFADYNTMNHKLLFADHGATGGQPAVTFSTANYSDLGFSLNDEVFIMMRGVPLVNKYLRGINFNANMPPANLDEEDDSQEFDQIFAMYPYISTNTFRPFQVLPTAVVFGSVSNFREQVTVQDQTTEGGDGLTFDVDLRFSIYGNTYFDDIQIGTKDDPLPLDVDFERSSALNGDKEYFLVLPAGNFTIVVNTFTVGSSNSQAVFEETSKEVQTGPGGVRKVDLRMGRPVTESNTTN